MPSSNKTSNLKLTQYIGSDTISYLQDYNNDMQKIDNNVNETNTKIINAEKKIETLSDSIGSDVSAKANINLSNVSNADMLSKSTSAGIANATLGNVANANFLNKGTSSGLATTNHATSSTSCGVSTTSVYGHNMIATDAEASSGTNKVKTITPFQLKTYGGSPMASNTEVVAGTNTTKTISPYQLKNFDNIDRYNVAGGIPDYVCPTQRFNDVIPLYANKEYRKTFTITYPSSPTGVRPRKIVLYCGNAHADFEDGTKAATIIWAKTSTYGSSKSLASVLEFSYLPNGHILMKGLSPTLECTVAQYEGTGAVSTGFQQTTEKIIPSVIHSGIYIPSGANISATPAGILCGIKHNKTGNVTICEIYYNATTMQFTFKHIGTDVSLPLIEFTPCIYY